MSVREDLQTAIRAYTREARHIPSAQALCARLEEIAQDIGRLPNPQSAGEGSVPKQYEGEQTPGQRAAGGTVEVHIHTEGPQFPARQQLLNRLRRNP